MLLKRCVYLLTALIFLVLTSCTIPFTVNIEPRTPIGQPKDVQSIRIPYSVKIHFNEDEVKSYRDYQYGDHDITYKFHTGKYLKEIINFYVYPHFDKNSERIITLDIQTYDIKGYEPKGEGFFSARRSAVDVTLETKIYYDEIFLYSVYTRGFSTVKVQLVDYSMWDATRNAIVEAVKKIPQEVLNVLSNPEGAIVKVEERIRSNPSSQIDYFSLAHLSLLLKKYDNALAAAKRAVELNPKDSASYILLGDIQKGLKNYSQAMENYKKAIAINPNYCAWYGRLSGIYQLQENFTEMVNLWQKAVSINPDWVTYYWLASAYTKVGRYKDAITNLNKAIELATIIGIGAEVAVEKKYLVFKEVLENGPAKTVGIEVGDKIVKIDEKSTEGWDINKVIQNLRGAEGSQVKLTIERGDKEFEKVITRKKIIQKGAAGPYGLRSLIYWLNGDKEQSFKDAEIAYSLDPNNGEAKTAISFAYIQKGNPDEAIKILSASKEDFDKLLITIAYAKKGDFDKASSVYRDMPEDYLMSKSVLRQDLREMALQSMKPYIEGKRKQVQVLEAKGQYKEALKEYRDIIRFLDKKEAREIRSHIARLLREKPYLLELPEEARKFAIRAEEYTKEGRFEEAISEYKKALEIVPFHPDLYKALALNYGGAKQYRKAVENMSIYLELYPNAPDVRAAKDEIYRWEIQMEREGR